MSTVLSHVITVTTAGTAVRGPSTGPGLFAVNADPTNTGYIYLGNDGTDTVSSSTGYKIFAGAQVIIALGNLNQLWFNSSVNGEKATVLALELYRSA